MERAALIKVVEMIDDGIKENSINEEAKCVTFDNTYLTSNNDDIAVSVPFPIGIKGRTQATELLKLLKKLRGKDVVITKPDKEFEIKCGKTTVGLYEVSGDSESPFDASEIKDWTKLPDDFSQGLKFCAFSAANEGSQLDCLLAKDDKIASSDHFRITRYFMNTPIENEIKVPCKAAKMLISYNPIFINDNGSWLHFKNEDDVIFSCRTIAEEYPDVDAHFEPVEDFVNIELPKELNEIISRVKILSSKSELNTNMINIKIANNEMLISSTNDIGHIEEPIEVDYDGEEIEFLVDPDMLNQILPHVESITIGENLYFNGEKFDHIIALMGS